MRPATAPHNGHGRAADTTNGHRAAPPQAAATAEASRPGVQPPINADSARLVVTLYETEDVLADEHLLRAVVAMLKDAAGRDEVRLVIHDADGLESEFDLPRAAASEELARSLRNLVSTKGQVTLSSSRLVGAA